MDFSHLLHLSIIQPDKILDYGFHKTDDGFEIKKNIPETSFYAVIKISENKIDSTVYDSETEERYVLFDSPNANGSFVGEIRQSVKNLIADIKEKCFISIDYKERFVDFVKNNLNSVPDFPWADSPDYFVFRCENQKWFALVMSIPINKLGFKSEEKVWVVNLKVESYKICETVDNKTIFPAYHMNKKNWVTVLLSSLTDFQKICSLTENSYSLVNKK